ncbi:MAG: TolC family protein [Sediminibacterium sp.]|jgi:outer membrane protein
MKKIVLGACLFILATTEIPAQLPVNNQLKDLINLSFGYFPKLKEAQNAIFTAEDKVVLTDLNKLPNIGAQLGYNYITPVSKATLPINGNNQEIKFIPNHNYTSTVNANYTIADFGRLKASIERSKIDLQLAKDNIELIKNQLANQVATIYYNMVYLQKAIGIQDSVLLFLNENKKVVQTKLTNGEALKLDLLNIQANIDNEENKKIDLMNGLQKQQNLLTYTTGTSAKAGNSFDFDITKTSSNKALETSVTNNVEFKLAKDKVDQAVADIAIAKLQDKPSLNVYGAAGFKNGYLPDIYQFKLNSVAGVSFNIPLYMGTRTKQQLKLQGHLATQQQLALSSLNANYKKDIDQALLDIQTNVERIGNTQAQIDLAKYAQQIASVRFKNGVGTNLELTNASTNVQRAELNRLQYQYQLCLAKLELAKLMGSVYWQ